MPALTSTSALRDRPDDPSDVVFTSGTTGNPKGVVMTHGQTLRAYLDWCDWADLRAGDRYLIVNPFFHIFGYKAGVLASLMRGATIRSLAVFDAAAVCDIVGARTSAPPAPPGADALPVAARRARARAPRHLEPAPRGHGRGRHPVELIRRVREELPFERILTGYGLTEGGTVTGSRPDDDFEHIATTVGVPWPGFEVRTVTESGAHRAGRAGRGRGAGRDGDAGYLDDPEATAAAIDADGFLHTGDLGTFDADGYLRIVGRIKDMFIVGGFNAYPGRDREPAARPRRRCQVAVIGVPRRGAG